MRKGTGPRVWILGAGFSKPLGGPLINDLLAKRELATLTSLFPSPPYKQVAGEQYRVRLFYHYGHERGYWDHAEQFLDLVESAAHEQAARNEVEAGNRDASKLDPQSHGATLLESLLKEVGRQQGHTSGVLFDSIKDLARVARQALAIDCSVFLRSAQLDSERWQPHMNWVKALDDGDIVITFNYDYVPELLGAATGKLRVVSPNQPELEIADARERKETIVLKLHGSITWVTGADGVRVVGINDPALADPRSDFVIGVPGPGKRKVYRESLAYLRGAAMFAIREARQITFVGYRFPPTDGDARRDILGAIHHSRQPFVSVETILGPSINNDDSTRLRELLRVATSATVTSAPLYAEDYFSLMRISDDLSLMGIAADPPA